MMINKPFAIDTNILVYAYNQGSPFHQKAGQFLSQKMTQFDEFGQLSICICQQSCIEFVHSITWHRLERPLTLQQAIDVIDYLQDCGLTIIHPKNTQITTFANLIKTHFSRNKIFDTAITATLKDNGINGIYTANTRDFTDYPFLTVINPLI